MLKRLGNLIRGFLSLFISGLERENPRALIEAEKENLRRQIARFNDSLANHAAFVERLMRQVKNLEAQEKDYAAKAAANLKVGNRSAAGQYALQLKTVKEQLESDLQVEYSAINWLNQAIIAARAANDSTTEELMKKILEAEEEHTDWIETQLELIRQVGDQNYLAQQIKKS